jgi:two-component system, LytTR family, response regulator
MNKIKCLIADDEQLSLEVLESYIRQLDKLQLVGRCRNGIEVFNTLKDHRVDLLFLDIEMPRLTGIELLRTLQHPPKVVLTTAFRDFALEGFELNVLDYLLKPVSFEKFLKALDKYESAAGRSNGSGSPATISSPDISSSFIYVKADKKMIKIFLGEILFIEGMKDYVKIRTADKETITYQTMSHFEEKLPDTLFLRAHRSFIVAIDKITAYSASRIEILNWEIPIGQYYQKEVLKRLSEGAD